MVFGLFGSGADIKSLLSAYAVTPLPHAGEGKTLSAAQRAENLAHFMAHKDAQCARVMDLCQKAGFELMAPGSASATASSSQTLHAFVIKQLARQKNADKVCDNFWRDSAVQDADARLLALAIDIGVYCGECVTRSPLGFDWRIDDTAYRPKDTMMTAGNVVISNVSKIGSTPKRLFHDIIGWTVYSVCDAARVRAGKTLGKLNQFQFLDDFLGDRY
jgi:hypothetical protein